jgi:pimeloyl-ACP methyl ester carboxylesterase
MSTWILLRGLTRETRHWGSFPALLADAFPEDRVIPLELPGNGVLHGQASPARIPAMASQARAEAARLGLQPPIRLLAMSMGAMVEAAWAQAHPEEVQACVLINTSFGAFSPLHHRMRPQAWPALLGLLLARTDRRREQLIYDLTSRLGPPGNPVVEAWAALRRSRPVSPANTLRQLLAAARFRAPSAAPVPTLILASAGDALVDGRCSAEIARRWACPLAVHPSAGHDLPLDDGGWVVEEVRAWLARRPPPD